MYKCRVVDFVARECIPFGGGLWSPKLVYQPGGKIALAGQEKRGERGDLLSTLSRKPSEPSPELKHSEYS